MITDTGASRLVANILRISYNDALTLIRAGRMIQRANELRSGINTPDGGMVWMERDDDGDVVCHENGYRHRARKYQRAEDRAREVADRYGLECKINGDQRGYAMVVGIPGTGREVAFPIE